jgi:hypothetical protein
MKLSRPFSVRRIHLLDRRFNPGHKHVWVFTTNKNLHFQFDENGRDVFDENGRDVMLLIHFITNS